MTPFEQLAQSARSAQSQAPPPSFFPPSFDVVGSLVSSLGNAVTQRRAAEPDLYTVMEMYRRLLSGAAPAVRLALLKEQRFTREGRRERMEASLAALYAPQPIELTIEQWKEVLEEEEDEG